MIAISSMTLADVIAAMEMRAAQFMTPYNSDWQTLAQYVRDARRDLFNRTNPFKEWSYQNTVSVINNQTVPADFIRAVRMTTRLTADPLGNQSFDRYEARLVDPREWMNLTNVSSANMFTRGFEKTGLYMIWANVVDSDQWSNTPMSVWIYPDVLTGQMDYIASYANANLNSYGDLIKIPIELESLLIDMAIARFLEDVADPQRLVTATQNVIQKITEYQQQQIKAKQATSIDAQAIPNPEPMVPKQTPVTPGGLL